MEKRPRQHIHYLRTTDGVQLAWADASAGPLLIKAANWLTHLEYEWESPVWGHWLRFFSGHFRLVRYDERGCGMSDWNVGDLSPDGWIEDMEAVVAAAAPQGPFALLGISQGAVPAVSFAARHPERVSHLLLYGAYARGWSRRGDPDAIRAYQAIVDLTRFGWGQDNPAFRQVFTSRFVPGATEEQMNWFNELCRKTTSPRIAADLLEARSKANVVDLLERVRTPTLVVHARNDQVVPLAEGRLIASVGSRPVALIVPTRRSPTRDRTSWWDRERAGEPGCRFAVESRSKRCVRSSAAGTVLRSSAPLARQALHLLHLNSLTCALPRR